MVEYVKNELGRIPRHYTEDYWYGGYRRICEGSGVIVKIYAKPGAKVGQYEKLY